MVNTKMLINQIKNQVYFSKDGKVSNKHLGPLKPET